ncbi:MAG: RNA methyltransferase [Clostridia bacterium]|nr:RNA methyltransferase [Clostridia bacterium]
MSEIIISGFVSVKSVIEAKSRIISKVLIERSRYESVTASSLRTTDKRRYETLKASGCEIEYLEKEEFERIVSNPLSGGIAAAVGERIYTPEEDFFASPGGYIAVLDGIEDPFNFAYSLRSLYASGVDGVIVPERSFFGSDDNVIRSSAGASELMNTCAVADTAEAVRILKTKGFTIASTAKEDGAKDLYRCRFKKPLCVVYGGEKRGIKREIIGMSDLLIRIKYPRDCHYSLPACSAVSVISFEIAQKLSSPGFPK